MNDRADEALWILAGWFKLLQFFVIEFGVD